MVDTVTARISKITLAIAFSVVVCMVGIGPAFAADYHDAGHGHAQGHEVARHHGRSHYEAVPPNYYYAPPPNYYSAPEPEYPASEGINLFFKL